FNIASVITLTVVAGAWLGAESTNVGAEKEPTTRQEVADSTASAFEQQRQHSAPVAWALISSNKSLIYPRDGYSAEILRPLRPLYMGNVIEIPDGEKISILIPGNMTRRHYEGPAKLSVIKDTVSVRQGPKAKVFPADPERLKLARRWSNVSVHPSPLVTGGGVFSVQQPRNNAMLLTTNPVFHFAGKLPRDGQLIIFGENGRRFWVQPLDEHVVDFPPAAQFSWGQKFTWEVRKSTGGRVLNGSFEIAPEDTAFDLLRNKVVNLPETPREELLFYGVKLELARAFDQADDVWNQLGTSPYRR
ncbi:MAG: hypothetical protein R3194_10540, partial [Limnobacter sp.]|nr:hypothetical protein [Limnobacter sp.]